MLAFIAVFGIALARHSGVEDDRGRQENELQALWIDRTFEDVVTSVRVEAKRTQLYVREGSVITQWYDRSLTESDQAEVWSLIDAVELRSFEGVHAPPAVDPGGPPIIREPDDLVMCVYREHQGHYIRLLDRSSGPAPVVRLAAEVEALARKGEAPRKPAYALMAEPLDVPNYPHEETVAQTLQRGGVSFVSPSRQSLESSKSVLRALDSPGWLIAVDHGENLESMSLPTHLLWQGKHYQMRQLRVDLIDPN